MFKYRNKSENSQTLIGHGVVAPGETVESQSAIENPNFEFVGEAQPASVTGTEAPQPNAVIEATQIPEQPANNPEENN